MKISLALLVLIGAVAPATVLHAQSPAAPADPLTNLQGIFGAVVGQAFRAPDAIVAASAPGLPATVEPLGGVLRTSLEIPGAAFRAVVAPLGGESVVATADSAPRTATPVQRSPSRKLAKRYNHRHAHRFSRDRHVDYTG